MMTIFYEVHNGLYVNLTNKCPCNCTFCLRKTMESVGGSGPLWLDHSPSKEEVFAALDEQDLSKYEEVVFCGFGEPTEAFELLKETAAEIKSRSCVPIRLNTNGLGCLVNGRDIVPEMAGLIDTVSISLNTPDPEEYYNIVRPRFGRASHAEMLRFAAECAKVIPKVVLTTVDTTIPKEEEEKCRQICESLGVSYRIRPWEE